MKRSGSKSLEDLFGAGQARPHGSTRGQRKSQRAGSRSSAGRGYGLASSGGMARSGSLGASMSGASSGGAGAAVAGRSSGQEVCSPPPSKSLRFLAPPQEVPCSPFAAAADRQQQMAADGGAPAPRSRQQQQQAQQQAQQQEQQPMQQQLWADDDAGPDGEAENQENQQPSPDSNPAASWLSPAAARPRAKTGAAPAPLTIPSLAGLLSPGPLPTPVKGAEGGAGSPRAFERAPGLLTHSPSFSSWMIDAARPPAPPPACAPPACAVDVSDVVGGLGAGAARAPRGFGTASGAPTHLDRILAALGDSFYPASLAQWEREELPDSDAERA